MVRSGKFQHFDYGKDKNMKVYGKATPTDFDLTRIQKVPVAMITGKQDVLGTPKNSAWIQSKIKSIIHATVIDGYDHNSFVYNQDGFYLKDVLELVQKYNPITKS